MGHLYGESFSRSSKKKKESLQISSIFNWKEENKIQIVIYLFFPNIYRSVCDCKKVITWFGKYIIQQLMK